MTTNRFLTIVNGVRRFVTAISSSAGATDANKIVATDSTGKIDPSLIRSINYILVADQKSSGTAGGDSISGTQTRQINTELVDTGNHCSLSSNQITLLAGTYRYRLSCPAVASNQHQCWLYNVSDSAVVSGAQSSEYSNAGSAYATTRSEAVGRFTITSTKVFEVQHYIQSAASGAGLGIQVGAGQPETYAIAEFWRES